MCVSLRVCMCVCVCVCSSAAATITAAAIKECNGQVRFFQSPSLSAASSLQHPGRAIHTRHTHSHTHRHICRETEKERGRERTVAGKQNSSQVTNKFQSNSSVFPWRPIRCAFSLYFPSSSLVLFFSLSLFLCFCVLVALLYTAAHLAALPLSLCHGSG